MRANREIIYYEVSARSGSNIEEAFAEMSQKLLEKGQQRKTSGFRITSMSMKSLSQQQQTISMRGDPRLQTPETACCSTGGGCCKT